MLNEKQLYAVSKWYKLDQNDNIPQDEERSSECQRDRASSAQLVPLSKAPTDLVSHRGRRVHVTLSLVLANQHVPLSRE